MGCLMLDVRKDGKAMNAWNYLRQLSELPPRGSGTDGERQAAEWLAAKLTHLGYDVDVQPFATPRHTLYLGPAAISAVLIGAIALSAKWPTVALLVAVVSFIPLLGELLGSGPNFNLFLPKSRSQNVFATRGKDASTSASDRVDDSGAAGPDAKSRAEQRVQDIIVVAHYDTQWGSWLFAPWFRPVLQPFFLATYAAIGLAFIAIVLRSVAPAAVVTSFLASAAVVLLIITGGFLLLSCVGGRAVPGANDNGSGVAVGLALADEWSKRELDGIRLSFLFTGAEEVGMRGMHHFMEHAKSLPADTLFINLDNVGGGRLRYLLGEGMVGYQHYDAALVAIAGRVAEEFDGEILPLKNLLLPTDALIPAKAGYAAITLLATNEDESIPNYHWHTDTFDNADEYTVRQTERFMKRYIEVIAERAQANAS